MKSTLRFGPGGVPLSTVAIKDPKINNGKKLDLRRSAIYRLKELKLNHMELEFVRGVNITEANAESLGKLAKKNDITLTAHGSYYINLASLEKPKYYASLNRVKKTLWAAQLTGCKSITFHAAFYQGRRSEEVSKIVYKAILEIIEAAEEENAKKSTSKKKNTHTLPLISPETTGKPTQWGSLDEILNLADAVNQKLGRFAVSACVDFAHLHARSGGQLNSYDEFLTIIKQIQKKLGKQALKQLHMHMSGINYNEKGERNHLVLEKSDLKYKELLKALKDMKVAGWVTCESPNLEEDAAMLKRAYEALS